MKSIKVNWENDEVYFSPEMVVFGVDEEIQGIINLIWEEWNKCRKKGVANGKYR